MESRLNQQTIASPPQDPLYSLRAAYRADSNPNKIDAVIGVYRDENGNPWILPTIKKAKAELEQELDIDHEYLPIPGEPSFIAASQRLLLGSESSALKENRVVSFQTISGTGAVHLGALFLAKFFPFPKVEPSVQYGSLLLSTFFPFLSNEQNGSATSRVISLPSPTWPNHQSILSTIGLSSSNYTYLDTKTLTLDIGSMLKDLEALPNGSVVLLHACAHNPSGVDPSPAEWEQIARVMKEKKHFPFFDCAYQGFASGNVDTDAFAVRLFIEAGFEMCVAQSYSKNMGLYGERVGCIHFIIPRASEATQTEDWIQDTRARIHGSLSVLQRSEISNPPSYGARLVSKILNNPSLYNEWLEDLKTMSERIMQMRIGLSDRLKKLETPGDWSFITRQIGMFSYTGLSESQIEMLRTKFSVYVAGKGRISMAGLTPRNVDWFAKALDEVVRATS